MMIYKYSTSQVICRENFVIFVSRDVGSSLYRIQPRPEKKIVYRSQVAREQDYLYIPSDVCPRSHDGYDYPHPLDCREMERWDWLQLKTKYLYYGEKGGNDYEV